MTLRLSLFRVWERAAVMATIAAALVLPGCVFAAEPSLHLPTHLEQGQLVIGRAPAGTQIEFAGRKLHVGTDGTFACWGSAPGTTPSGKFANVSVSYQNYACAVTSSARLQCWGALQHPAQD